LEGQREVKREVCLGTRPSDSLEKWYVPKKRVWGDNRGKEVKSQRKRKKRLRPEILWQKETRKGG